MAGDAGHGVQGQITDAGGKSGPGGCVVPVDGKSGRIDARKVVVVIGKRHGKRYREDS